MNGADEARDGVVLSWRPGDEELYPVREGRCQRCERLFAEGDRVQERPRLSLNLYHAEASQCGAAGGGR